MEFLELIQRRQSVRAYDQTRPVEHEKLERCVEAVRLAPSACNAQPWKLIIVDEPVLKNLVAEAASAKWLGFNNFPKQAPVMVVIVREEANLTSKLGTVLKDKPYPVMDVGIATAHFCLQAAADGLGTCILGWFDEDKVKQLLHIPKKKRVELLISVGYPAKDHLRTKIRKKTSEMCSFNSY